MDKVMDQAETRFRMCAKQTAKNLWQLDATIEYRSDKISKDDVEDAGATTTLGLRLLSMIKETELAFRKDKRKMVGDGE